MRTTRAILRSAAFCFLAAVLIAVLSLFGPSSILSSGFHAWMFCIALMPAWFFWWMRGTLAEPLNTNLSY